jgi:hypothetical protein
MTQQEEAVIWHLKQAIGPIQWATIKAGADLRDDLVKLEHELKWMIVKAGGNPDTKKQPSALEPGSANNLGAFGATYTGD